MKHKRKTFKRPQAGYTFGEKFAVPCRENANEPRTRGVHVSFKRVDPTHLCIARGYARPSHHMEDSTAQPSAPIGLAVEPRDAHSYGLARQTPTEAPTLRIHSIGRTPPARPVHCSRRGASIV